MQNSSISALNKLFLKIRVFSNKILTFYTFFCVFTFSKCALFLRDPFRSRGLLLLPFCPPWCTPGHLFGPLALPEGPFGTVWGVFWAPGAPFWPSDGASGVPWGAPGSPRDAFRVPGPPFWPSKGFPGGLWGALGPPSGCLLVPWGFLLALQWCPWPSNGLLGVPWGALA